MLSTQWQGQRPTEGPAIHYREANAIRQVKEILVLEKGSCVCMCTRAYETSQVTTGLAKAHILQSESQSHTFQRGSLLCSEVLRFFTH